MNNSFFINRFAQDIFERKYQGEMPDVHSYYKHLASIASLGDIRLEFEFFRLFERRLFSPGGRILAYAGRPGSVMSLMNCTTHSIEGDSLEDISRAGYRIMRASSRGQGIGINLSALRPNGTPVNNAAKTSTGAISFMEMLNAIGGTIGQEGRRAAMLFSLDVGHPDLYRGDGYDFLNVKRIPGKVENANISVMISDEFMRAVQEDKMWDLRYSGVSGGKDFTVEREVPAKELFNILASSAHASAEPGILYWDTSKRMSNSDMFGERWNIVGTNACSEEILDQDGVCNLGSMNLAAYVKRPFSQNAHFDIPGFIYDVYLAVEFLDNMVSLELQNGNYISDEQAESLAYLRRTGLGVMGLADALAMLGLPYREDERTEAFLNTLFLHFRDAAYLASASLAKQKGPALAWMDSDKNINEILNGGFFATLSDDVRNVIKSHGTRNVTVLSIAPTGTISNLYGVASGIEPLFEREYIRRIRMNGEDEFVDYVHPGVELSRMMGVPDDIWVTAYEATPDDHLFVLAVAQKYIDASISKTINFPATATPEDVANVYMRAWELGIKGLSVYVQNSRHEQVLYTKEELTFPEDKLVHSLESVTDCPECGSQLVHKEGCVECLTCSFALCAL